MFRVLASNPAATTTAAAAADVVCGNDAGAGELDGRRQDDDVGGLQESQRRVDRHVDKVGVADESG